MTRILNEKWLTRVDFSKGVIELTEWEEKIYQQGKADAIDDALNEVTKRMSDYLEFDDLKIDWDLFCNEMKEIAEQLKEQKK